MAEMPMPPPYAQSSDEALVDGCIGGDEDAWKALDARHGRLVEAVVTRVLDQRRPGHLDDVPPIVQSVVGHLRRNGAGPLRTWDGACDLKHYLAVVARQKAEEHVQEATPVANLVASLPTPAAVFLDDLVGVEPAKRITDALDRLSPHVTAMVRLRLRGLEREGIAAALGMPRHTVTQNLERIAERLGEMQHDDDPSAARAWRMLLDCAPMGDKVELAIRTEDEPAFQQTRSMAEGTWRAVRERALTHPHPRTGACLYERDVAAFVDGSIRGADRARAEGHLATCPRCIDSVATLTTDVRVFGPLREARHADREVAVAAACISTTRFLAGELLASRAIERGCDRGEDLARLARVGLGLEGGRRGEEFRWEPSRVVSAEIPSDEEAPLVAIEALVHADPHAAGRAIDDHMAKSTLGARLRLLAAAAGSDFDQAKRVVEQMETRRVSDPGLSGDADAVRALPEGRALPREILVERLRDAIPEAVRFVLSRR